MALDKEEISKYIAEHIRPAVIELASLGLGLCVGCRNFRQEHRVKDMSDSAIISEFVLMCGKANRQLDSTTIPDWCPFKKDEYGS